MNFESKAFRAAAILALATVAPRPSEAKVLFTGYGNFQMGAHQLSKIYGDAPALAAFKLTDTSIKSRGFTVDSLGLFASSNLKEGLEFSVDFTYRKIGNTVGETRIQYAYLEHAPWEDFTYRVGRITLPFGYFNQKRFYPFQRVELTAPVFQSAILGLPIADIGAGAQKRFRSKAARIDVDVYAVNGYGPTPTDPTKFRSATLPGALILAGNLGPGNTNANVAFGGRINLAELGGRDIETGVSYYGGAWDSGGTKYFQMANAHFHAVLRQLDILTEYLHLDVAGDPGFAASVGESHWMTDGYFLTLAYPLWRVSDMPLTPYVASEGYVSRGRNNRGGQERLQGYRAGLSLKPLDPILVKLEYGFLRYALPLVGLGDLKLDAHSVLLALSVTF